MDVLLAIQVTEFVGGETITTAIAPLAALGGRLVSWQPELNGAPIKARFKVKTETERDQFVAAALKIRGVSLAVSPNRSERIRFEAQLAI
jgi:hypothetical protein